MIQQETRLKVAENTGAKLQGTNNGFRDAARQRAGNLQANGKRCADRKRAA